jgi:hypothetical protein
MFTRIDMKHKRRHIRYRFKVWHGIVALLLLLFVLFHVSGRLKLNRRIETLRTKGYPVTLEELARSQAIPQGRKNAADVYLSAFSHYKKWDSDAMDAVLLVGRAEPPSRDEPLDAQTRQTAERFLSDNQQTLSLLHEAASIEHCRYPEDFTKESDPRASWRDKMLTAVQLLGLQALIASEQKDDEKFLASISESLALARSVDGPLMIHHLTHGALLAHTYRSVERAISRISLTDEQLQRLSGWLKASNSGEGFKQALLAEQCLALHTFTAPLPEVSKRMGEQEKSMYRMFVFSRMLGLNSRYALSYIDLMQKCLDALELPDPRRLETFDAVQENVRSGKEGGVITHLLWPALARTLQFDILDHARARATQAGLAVERYRLAEGHLPQSLDNLVPAYLDAVPKDPFDGQDMRYRVRKTGFVVYSIGEDLSDDGGAERDSRRRDANGKTPPWDVTFIVER